MRKPVNRTILKTFFASIAKNTSETVDIFFTGGVTALMHGWRATTIDIDMIVVPERDEIYRALPEVKEALHINIELVAPSHFIPELPGWRERCLFIERIGKTSFFHYDLYSQAISKIERGHTQDVFDAKKMVETKLIELPLLSRLFEEIFPNLYRYPAIDEKALKIAFADFIKQFQKC